MKLLFVLLFVTLGSCELDPKTFDWSSVRPINQIPEWRAQFPQLVDEPLDESKRVYVERGGRIIRGTVAGPTDFPFVVGVILHLDTTNGFCGGSLVSQRFVLTAANCLFSLPSSTVVLGSSDKSRIEEIIPTARYRMHEAFNSETTANDIALLELSRPATLSPTIRILRLPNRRQIGQLFENQEATVAGWGTTGGSNVPVPVQNLRSVRAAIITNTSCRIRYPNFIIPSNICTDVAVGTPCSGDEGSPLLLREADGAWTQIGIFSFQFSLGCDRGWPPVYTRVTAYLDWIGSNSDVVIRETWE